MRALSEVPAVVWKLAAGRFIIQSASFLTLFLTLYLTEAREVPVASAGLLAGLYGAGILAGYLTGGRWGDNLGHRRVLIGGFNIAGLGIALIPVTPTVLLPVTFPLTAYAAASAGISVAALSALAVKQGNRRLSVAIGRSAGNAGFTVGPPLGALVAAHSFEVLFVAEGLIMAVTSAFVGSSLTGQRVARVEAPAGEGVRATLRAAPGSIMLLVGVVLADVVYRQLYSTVPLQLRDAGQPLAVYAALVAGGSAAILLLEIPVTLGLRRAPATTVIPLGYVLVGVGFAGFGLVGETGIAVLAMVTLTAGELLYKSSATAYFLDLAPAHLIGRFQGLYSAASTSGTMIAAPLGTAIYAFRPGLLWPSGAVLSLVAASIVLASRRISRPPAVGPAATALPDG